MPFRSLVFALLALAATFPANLAARSVIQMPAVSGEQNPIGTAFATTPLTAGPTFPASGEAFAIFTRPTANAADVTYWVASTSGTASFRILNKDFQEVKAVNLGATTSTAAMTKNGTRFLIATSGGLMRLYNAVTGDEIQVPNQFNVGRNPSDIVVSQDSRRAFVISALDQKITAVDLTNNTTLGTIQIAGISNGYATLAPTGLIYVSAENRVLEIDGSKSSFDSASIRRQFQLTGSIGRLAFTPDGTRGIGFNQNTSLGPVLYLLNLAAPGGGVANTSNSETGLAGVTFDKLYVTSNSRAYAISTQSSTASRKLFQLTIPDIPAPGSNLSPITATEALFGSLGTLDIAGSLTHSNEFPAARQLFIGSPLTLLNSSVPSRLYQIDAQNNNKTSEASLTFVPGLNQFVTPAASSIVSQPGLISGINGNQAIPVSGRGLPIGVRVTTSTGEPIFGLPVAFTSNVAGIVFDNNGQSTTNSDGLAFIGFTAPPTAGTFGVIAAPAGTSLTQGFTLTATTGSGGGGGPVGSTIEVVSGDGQIVREGEGAFLPLLVLVKDAAGQPAANVDVTWTVAQGGGFFLEGDVQSGDGGTTAVRTTKTDATGKTSNRFQSPNVTVSFGNISVQSVLAVSTVSSNISMYATTIARVVDGVEVNRASGEILAPEEVGGRRTITGKVGQTLNGAIQVRFTQPFPAVGLPLQNVGIEVAMEPPSPNGPQVSCTPLPVPLSGINGVTTCDVKIGGRSGSGIIKLSMGGGGGLREDGSITSSGAGVANIYLEVTPGDPGQVAIVQGNNQSGRPNENLPAALIAVVRDGGGNPLPGATVRWEVVSAANSATVVNPQTTTNATGQVSATVRLGAVPGPVQIKVTALSGNQPSVIFNASIAQVASAFTKVSGDPQTAFINANYLNPLVVVVRDGSSTPQPVSGANVVWTVVSGSATLTGTSPTATNASGQAQMTVRAGATAGPVQIRAELQNTSLPAIVFNLSVQLPGPVVSLTSFRNTASGEFGAVTPGGLVTIVGEGLAPDLRGSVESNLLLGPWRTRLNDVEIQFGTTLAPIYQVANINGVQSVTVQVPFDLAPNSSVAVTIRVGGGSTVVNSVPVVDYQPGMFETVDANNRRYAVALRPNGTFITPDNPARLGETVRVYLTGLGQTTAAITAGQAGVGQRVNAELIAGFNDQGVRLVSAAYAQNMVGVYEVMIELPTTGQTGSDRPIAVLVARPNGQTVFGNGSVIAVAP